MDDERIETEYSGGAEGGSDARKPDAPEFVQPVTEAEILARMGAGTVVIDIAEAGNSERVKYLLRMYTGGTLTGYVQADGTTGAGEVWQTASEWGDIALTGLTNFVEYTFDAKAVGDSGVASDWSNVSAVMNTMPDIDEGLESDAVTREVTGGNVVIDETYGITITGDTVPEVTNETQYYGTIEFGYKIKSYDLDVASIEAEYSEDAGETWATASSSGGDGKTGLTTSVAGLVKRYRQPTYIDMGASEYKRGCMLRIRPVDADGDIGDWVYSDVFIVYNRPAKPTVINYDGRSYDKGTTPIFSAKMPYLRGGGPAWPVIRIYDVTAGSALVSGYPKNGVWDVRGWEYETSAGVFTPLTVTGIDATYCDNVLRMKYEVQTALEKKEYLITMTMGELKRRG